MPMVWLSDIRLNVEQSGPVDGAPLVLIHALGTNLRLFDGLMPFLSGYRVLRIDLRGHGLSDVPSPPYSMGALIHDVERVLDHLECRDAVLFGVSLGGLIVQGLAAKRMDLVRAMVLSNTAAKIGSRQLWETRVAEVTAAGLVPYAPAALERMLGRRWQDHPAKDRLETMLLATDPKGWAGCAAAIGGCDFYTTTAALRLPSLVMAGGNDGTTPADLVRETAELIPGHDWHLFPRLGHLPMLEDPKAVAKVFLPFLTRIGHNRHP